MLLSDNKVDPTASDNYAIKWACSNGNVESLKILLADPRVDPSAQNNKEVQMIVENIFDGKHIQGSYKKQNRNIEIVVGRSKGRCIC